MNGTRMTEKVRADALYQSFVEIRHEMREQAVMAGQRVEEAIKKCDSSITAYRDFNPESFLIDLVLMEESYTYAIDETEGSTPYSRVGIVSPSGVQFGSSSVMSRAEIPPRETVPDARSLQESVSRLLSGETDSHPSFPLYRLKLAAKDRVSQKAAYDKFLTKVVRDALVVEPDNKTMNFCVRNGRIYYTDEPSRVTALSRPIKELPKKGLRYMGLMSKRSVKYMAKRKERFYGWVWNPYRATPYARTLEISKRSSTISMTILDGYETVTVTASADGVYPGVHLYRIDSWLAIFDMTFFDVPYRLVSLDLVSSEPFKFKKKNFVLPSVDFISPRIKTAEGYRSISSVENIPAFSDVVTLALNSYDMEVTFKYVQVVLQPLQVEIVSEHFVVVRRGSGLHTIKLNGYYPADESFVRLGSFFAEVVRQGVSDPHPKPRFTRLVYCNRPVLREYSNARGSYCRDFSIIPILGALGIYRPDLITYSRDIIFPVDSQSAMYCPEQPLEFAATPVSDLPVFDDFSEVFKG